MVNIDDSDKLIRWWREQLEGNQDWNSLPNESKKQLLLKLQRCVSALLNFHITKEELLKLVQLTDIVTVFESCISMLALTDLDRKNKYQMLAYLTRVVLNSELGKFKKEPIWHREPPTKKRKGNIATLEYAKKYDPFNFKHRYCSLCGGRIRKDNSTSVCSKCQGNGRNGNSIEH